MKLRLSFLIAILLIAWSVPPAAHGMPPTRWQMFEELSDQTLPIPTENTAVIVFVLPRDTGDAIGGLATGGLLGMINSSSVIYDVTSEQPMLVGTIKRGAKIAYAIPTGEYMFQAENLLAVNVVAGKTYYVHVDQRGGIGLVSKLEPVRNGSEGKWQYSSESFQEVLDKMVLIKTHPKAQEYFGSAKWQKRISKFKKNLLKKWDAKSDIDRQKLTLNPEDGVFPGHYSKQNSQITQTVKTEPNTAQPSLDEQKEIRTSAVENPKSVPEPVPVPEPVDSVSPSNTSELEALMTLRDDGIISEDEFQKQKTEILASTQRIQTPAQPKPQIEEVEHAEIGYIVGDPPSKKHNSSIPGDAGGQQSQDSKKPLTQEIPTTDKGTSEKTAGNQNDSSEVKKTEWVREVGGRKLYCVRTAEQTICQ